MDLLEVFKDSQDLVEFPAGAVIVAEGDEGEHMYVLMQGEVSISLNNRELARVSAGEIVGEMALINEQQRSATATAISDCRLVVIDQSSFSSLVRYVPEFSLHIMNVIAERLRKAYEMLGS